MPTSDLNNALLGYILTGYSGFTTAAGHIGHKYKIDHDISLLMPELWARLGPEERDPEFLKSLGYLEKVDDFKYKGKLIPASRLGWRITPLFAATYLGRTVRYAFRGISDDMLRPELQSLEEFVDGIENIATAMEEVRKALFRGRVVRGCNTPLKAVLSVMEYGNYEGKSIQDRKSADSSTANMCSLRTGTGRGSSTTAEHEIAYIESSISYLRRFLAERAEPKSLT